MFKQKLASGPEDVAVILPIRFPKTLAVESDMKLKNDFSVTILDLPLEENNFSKIRNRCNLIRRSADPLVRTSFLFLLNLLVMLSSRKYLGTFIVASAS